MAVTTTVVRKNIEGISRTASVLVSLDNSYPTGGEAVDLLGLLGWTRLSMVVIPSKSGYVFEWDYTNNKIIVYYGDNNNAADGPLIEVPNTTDLSLLTQIRIGAVGS